jgi:hypothetical protein
MKSMIGNAPTIPRRAKIANTLTDFHAKNANILTKKPTFLRVRMANCGIAINFRIIPNFTAHHLRTYRFHYHEKNPRHLRRPADDRRRSFRL